MPANKRANITIVGITFIYLKSDVDMMGFFSAKYEYCKNNAIIVIYSAKKYR